MVQYLELNRKVQIQLVKGGEKPEGEHLYSSYIVAITDDTVSLATPIHRSHLVSLVPGDQIRVYMWPIMLMFETEVLAQQLRPHPLLVVQRPETFVKTQRRGYVRLEFSLPVNLRILPTGSSDKKEPAIVKARTVDISGGGALIVYPGFKSPPVGTMLELAIELPEIVRCKGRIVRVETVEADPDRLRLAVEFTEIGRACREKVIAFIFKRHRELLQRGLS